MHDPDCVSFVVALRISRRSIAKQGAFPPDTIGTIGRRWAHAIGELIGRLLPRRRPRANPRVVKRKYTKWHVKRSYYHKLALTHPTTRRGRGDPIVVR